jgi:hypothetical protein
MDLATFARRKDASHAAEDKSVVVKDIVRVEITQEANDGQQYGVMLLDADDSFDIIITYPNTEREIVWSLVRERVGQ